MAREVPLYICRYEFSVHDDPVAPPEHKEVLEDLVGKPVAHRKADPTDDDKDTFVFKVTDHGQVEGQRVLTWHVGRQLTVRTRTRYDWANDDMVEEMINTDEIQFAKFIALPWAGVCAVVDRTSERNLPGASAVSRMKSVFSAIQGGKARITPAASSPDIEHALQNWQVDRFLFTVRPFNPTIRKPGDQIHELMTSDRIGEMSGTAKPAESEKGMHDSTHGLMAEARGLSDLGYGQYGFDAHTPGGRRASLPKPKFSQDKEKNLKQRQKERRLKIYIEEQPSADDETREVVQALIEVFQLKDRVRHGA